eukprot:63823_1
MSGKMPRNVKTEFDILQKRYQQVSELKFLMDKDMIKAFITLMKDCIDISKFSFNLQCARVIHDMKGKQKSFGTIAVSSSIVARSPGMDELLKEFGYSEGSILRFTVGTTRKRHGGYNFKSPTPFKLEPVKDTVPTSKIINDTVAKKRKKPRKSSRNKTTSNA